MAREIESKIFLVSFSKFFANVVMLGSSFFFFLQMNLKEVAELEGTEKVLSGFQVSSSHILIISNENTGTEIFLHDYPSDSEKGHFPYKTVQAHQVL